MQRVQTKLPVLFALKYHGPVLTEGYHGFTGCHYHSCCVYHKMTHTLKYYFSIMQEAELEVIY